MTTASPSARRLKTPGWFDLRLVLGVLLVAASVAIGARVVGSAGSTTGMLVVTHDLAAGTVLRESDVSVRQVRLASSAGSYYRSGSAPVGMQLTSPVHAGDLLARSAVGRGPTGVVASITVTDSVIEGIKRGQLVRMYVSNQNCPTTLVLNAVAVQDVVAPGSGALSGSNDGGLLVRVSADQGALIAIAQDLTDAKVQVQQLFGATPKDDDADPDKLKACATKGGS